MVDLEDLDVGQLRHAPCLAVQPSTNDHQLRRPPSADGIVDGGGTRSQLPRTITNSTRSPQLLGGPARTHCIATRSSSHSNAICDRVSEPALATRPSAAARPWHTSTAVRLAGRLPPPNPIENT